MKKVIIKIFGKVQGVGFRNSARQEARELKIVAEPRNEPNGSVHIEAHGPEKDLEKFVAWCRKGPWAARVTRIESEWGNEEKNKKKTGRL